MNNAQALARLHIATLRELSGLRKAEERMAASVRELERRLAEFDADIRPAEQTVCAYLRSANYVHEPNRPTRDTRISHRRPVMRPVSTGAS